MRTGRWTLPLPEGHLLSSKKKSIPAKRQNIQGNWETIKGAKVSNQKGAVISYSFKGQRVGIRGISNNTSEYARVIIGNSTGEEVINTIVDFYSKNEYASRKFLSPLMKKDRYTISIEVMGEQGVWFNKAGDTYGSTDDYVTIEDVFVVKN